MEGSHSQAGFYYQNNIAALKIIECLFFNSDITHVSLENYSKGNHIDDIIVYRRQKIDYIQVKWSEDSENVYTLYSLLTATPPKKSIFKQLAEGYSHVKNNTADFSITLFTTKRESDGRRPTANIHHGLSEIRNKVFEPARTNNSLLKSVPNYSEYKETVEIIRTECGLTEGDYIPVPTGCR